MTKDQLSPEDRALHDAFFAAYGEKHRELVVEGPDPCLDVCVVHAIRAMIARETAPRIVSAVGVGVKVRPPEQK